MVPKVVPPDKSVGAWPSAQEKTIGIGNVGKSPCGGNDDEHQSLKVQESPCEHSVVANQEEIPTGERSGTYPLPSPCFVPASVAPDLKERNLMLLTYERICKQESLSTLYYECVVDAEEIAKLFPDTELLRKSVAMAVVYALELSKSFLVILEGINEAAPHIRDPSTRIRMLKRSMKRSIEIFLGSIEGDQNIKSVLWKSENAYGQLLLEWEVLHKQIVSEDRAEKEKAEEEAAVEAAAAQKLTEEHRVLAQQQAEERAIAEKRAAGKQKAEEAFAKASAKAAAGKKVEEEKAARAAYEVDRKKKAVEKADAKRNAAKQADEAAKTNAAERLNAEMKAELRAVTAAAERKRAAGKQDEKATEKRRDLFQALWSFSKYDEARAQAYEVFQELEQEGREHRAHLHLLHDALLASHSAYREYLQTTCGWAIEITEIMLSLIEGSTGPLPDYVKKEIDTFTDKIAQEYSIQLELMTYECYQKLLTHKDAMSQSKRVGDRKTEDKASTKERTEDAEDGYVGPTYDAKEEKKQKVKERHTKERVRRKEQSEKRVPYETFVTLNGLQGATHLNGQRGRVMDKTISTG